MKKLISLLIAFLMVLSLIACNGGSNSGNPNNPEDPNNPNNPTPPVDTLASQIQIAKDTYDGIFKTEQAVQAMSIRPMAMAFSLSEEDSEEKPIVEEDNEIRNIPYEHYYATTNTTRQLLEVVDQDSLSYDYQVSLTQIDSNKSEGDPDRLICIDMPWPEIVSFKGVKEEDGYDKVYTSIITEKYPDLYKDLSDGYVEVYPSPRPFFGHAFYQISCSYYKSDTDYGFEYVFINTEYKDERLHAYYVSFDYKKNKTIFLAANSLDFSFSLDDKRKTFEEKFEPIAIIYENMNEKCEVLVMENIERINSQSVELEPITVKLEKTLSTGILNLEFNYDNLRAWQTKITSIVEPKEPEPQVYYKVNLFIDGVLTPHNKTALEGSSLDYVWLAVHDFDGWYTDETYTTKYNFPIVVTSDLNLYGVHEELKPKPEDPPQINYCTVYFFVDGGIYLKTHFEEGVIMDEGKYDLSDEKYNFDGWYLDEDCTEKFDFSTPLTEDLYLYGRLIRIE